MLKLPHTADERLGAGVLAWWDGDGAAQVFARDDDAVLMERAEGARSLAHMARSGEDDEATRILCIVAARLHRARPAPLPPLVPLSLWFAALWPAAATHGGLLARCAETAEALLVEQRDTCVLHGDIHHANVLDFGVRGWRAIDPKGLLGERSFDFCNIFTNPDLEDPSQPVATTPEHFQRRLAIVSETAGLERTRLLRWILTWTGLSWAWFLSDDAEVAIDRRIAELAAAELDR
jgi:streptomycin 6-kinase